MQDFHVDVVPGRYVDDSKTDAYLHQTTGDSKWLKTNLKIHIDHIRNSGVLDALRLMKLWNVRNVVGAKTFVLDLVVIELLKELRTKSLEDQLCHVWQIFKNEVDDLSVEDPANANNDLKPMLDIVREPLSRIAASTLNTIEIQRWAAIFGTTENSNTSAAIISAATLVERPTRPWAKKT